MAKPATPSTTSSTKNVFFMEDSSVELQLLRKHAFRSVSEDGFPGKLGRPFFRHSRCIALDSISIIVYACGLPRWVRCLESHRSFQLIDPKGSSKMNTDEKNSHTARMRVLPHWDWLKSPTAPLHFVIRITDLRTERARLMVRPGH